MTMVPGEANSRISHAPEPQEVVDAPRTKSCETPEIRKASLNRLRQLLREDASFQVPQEDQVLVMFLRSREYDIQRAFKAVKNYFKARRDAPEYFMNLTPDNVLYSLICTNHKLMMASKQKDSLGRTVGLVRIGAWNSSICSIVDFTRCLFVLVEGYLNEEETQINGFVTVFDMEGLSPYHLIHLTPRYFSKVLHILQDCLPMKTEKIYVVNNPPIFALLLAVVKPFLHRKIISRIELLGYDFCKLRAVVPADVIPEKHGGTLEHFDFHSQETFLRQQSSYFEEMARCSY